MAALDFPRQADSRDGAHAIYWRCGLCGAETSALLGAERPDVRERLDEFVGDIRLHVLTHGRHI